MSLILNDTQSCTLISLASALDYVVCTAENGTANTVQMVSLLYILNCSLHSLLSEVQT